MIAAPELLTRAPVPPVRALSLGQGPDMVADVWSPPAVAQGTVVILHGGFWREHIDRRHTSHMAQALATDNWEAISVEYPRIAGRPDLTHQAMRTTLTELLQSHITASPIVLLGHSAGGQLALWAADNCQPEFSSVVALAPVTSLQQAQELHLGKGAVQSFLGCSAQERPDLDPQRIATPAVPTTLIHGDQDQRVPITMSEQYMQDRPSITLVKLLGAGHFDLIDPQSVHWPAVLNALRDARYTQ